MLMKTRSCVFLCAVGECLFHNVLAAEIQRQIGEIPPQITTDSDFWTEPFIEGPNWKPFDIYEDDYDDFHYSPESVLNQFFWSVDDDKTADDNYKSSAPLGGSVQLPSEGTEKKNEFEDDYLHGEWFPYGVSDDSTAGDIDKSVPLDHTAVQLPLGGTEDKNKSEESGFASTVIGGIQNFAQHDNSFVFGGTVERHCTPSAANQFKVCSKEALFENVVVDGKLTLGPFTDVAAELEDALARAGLALRCALISLAINLALWVVVMLFLAKQLRSKAMENMKRKEEPSLNDYTLLPNEKQDPMKEALIVGPISQMELESGVPVHESDPQEHLIQAQVDNSSYSSRYPLTGVSFSFTPNQVDVKL